MGDVGLILDGVCYGALVYDEVTVRLEMIYADAVVMATGGRNTLFGKTTGSTQCDGYAQGQLFRQGAELKNLEFIQYHPTIHENLKKTNIFIREWQQSEDKDLLRRGVCQ